MADTDWTLFGDGQSAASVARGVTSGETPPNGGGSFVAGFNSLIATAGAVAWYTNQANFSPTGALEGASVRAAIKRGVSAGTTGFSGGIIVQAQGTSVNDHAYILGLSDEEPAHVVLVKQPIVDGLPSSPVAGADAVLRMSAATFVKDTWLHLRLDAIVNTNSDVILRCYANDLSANAVTAPVWAAITGMDAFVDDALGAASQLAGVDASFYPPFTTGYMGFGFQSSGLSRRMWFDHIVSYRQG